MTPNFSAYPFARLRKLSRRDAQVESTIAGWIAARPGAARLAKLAAGRTRAGVAAPASVPGLVNVRAEVVARSGAFDPFAARCEVRVGYAAIEVRGSSLAVRAITQRLLPGPDELAAPRPLTPIERSIWALVVATALEDLDVRGEVWPLLDDDDGSISSASEAKTRVGRPSKTDRSAKKDKRADDKLAGDRRADDKLGDKLVVELAVVLGDLSLSVQISAPAELLLRVPPARPFPGWFATTELDVPIVVGRCALDRRSLDRLAVRSVITLDWPIGSQPHARGPIGSQPHARGPARPSDIPAELDILGGSLGLRASTGALEAVVATEYVPRDMSLPDDAHVELTVALGTTKLSLRQLGELAVGQIVQLGRPLAGPFELRAAGRVLGRGELVDVDGELAVRIVSLGD